MSQNKVYKILQDLGGEASSSEIIDEAEKRYPDSSLSSYATVRLRSLEEKDVVEEISEEVGKQGRGRSLYWRITDYEWGGVPENQAKKDFPDNKNV